ncbi:MAG: hypothetical protein J0652_02685 [Desulfobulbaceae bacterium]|nr:hypothetical protein [Desulfobulbaceae bacterium]
MQDVSEVAKEVSERAKMLLAEDEVVYSPPPEFIGECLDANERGDGTLFATMHRGKFLYNTTPKDGEWYFWDGNVWTVDEFKRTINAVESCAIEYQEQGEILSKDIISQGIEKKTEKEGWKIVKRDKFAGRAQRLRNMNGAEKTISWAPVVDNSMACRESDFDRNPDLLPVKNGVIDLRTGLLTTGRPEDMLRTCLDLEYDPHADYTEWTDFLTSTGLSEEVIGFLKRSFGYGITGHSFEQYIWVFTGPGRNGKGVIFDLVGDVMRQYYHVISRAMLIEQRSEPGPSAATEHKYSLMGKRIIVGSETNKGQRIDAGAIKELTGDDDIKCRPLYKSEITFHPSHTLFLHTNHIPIGMTKDFALVQRLIKVELPLMFVDDPEKEALANPINAAKFRKKDPKLKERLRKIKVGILRWLVEGAREWAQFGLMIPDTIHDAVKKLADEEDYFTQFVTSCLERTTIPDTRITSSAVYDAFRWWWNENMDEVERKIPSKNVLNRELSNRGNKVERVGGKSWLYNYTVSLNITQDVENYITGRRQTA